MSKQKISESEIKRNALPGVKESFDLDMLEKYLDGMSIEALSNERFLPPGQVDLRIKITLKTITAFLGEKVPDRYYQVAPAFKLYWKNSIRQYQLLRMIRNPNSQFSIFLIYFKGCTKEERLRMFSELEPYVYK
jgi:hypothetical protein